MDQLNGSIFENLTDPALILDRSGRVREANRAFLQSFGLRVSDVIGSPFYSLLSSRGDCCPEKPCLFSGDVEGSERREHRFSMEGTEFFFEVDRRPLSGSEGGGSDWLITMRDVSASRRLARRVEKSEKRYHDLFHNAREGLALFSEAGLIRECNHSLARMLGYDVKDLEGIHLGRLCSGYAGKIFDGYLQGLKTMGFVTVEMEMLGKDRTEIPVEADINWLPYEELFRIMVRDVKMRKKIELSRKTHADMLEREVETRTRELRESEQEMRRQKKTAEGILRGTPIPMFVLDRNHRVMYWNRACEKLTGYSAREMVGTDYHWKPFYPGKRPLLADLVMEGDLEAMEVLYRDMNLRPSPVLEGGYEVEHFFPSLGRDGIHLHISAAPIMDDSGSIQGAIVSYQDLNEIYRLEKEKEQAQRMAAVGRTVAGLAHNIKNVLSGLEGGAYVINSALSKREIDLVEDGWDMIERNMEQISDIVTDMLIYSRERTPDYRPASPNELVAEVLELLHEKARLSGVELSSNLDPGIGSVAMDRTGIYRCLLNLVSNGVDACTLEGIMRGKGMVQVSTDRPSGWGVRFRVTDNGTGMSEDVRGKLFKEFFTTKGYKGTGLGLPVTYKIVCEHGGELTFESEPGRGTTFFLCLPERSLA